MAATSMGASDSESGGEEELERFREAVWVPNERRLIRSLRTTFPAPAYLGSCIPQEHHFMEIRELWGQGGSFCWWKIQCGSSPSEPVTNHLRILWQDEIRPVIVGRSRMNCKPLQNSEHMLQRNWDPSWTAISPSRNMCRDVCRLAQKPQKQMMTAFVSFPHLSRETVKSQNLHLCKKDKFSIPAPVKQMKTKNGRGAEKLPCQPQTS